MKLYTTPLSILTLVTWVPHSRLAFGHSAHRLSIGPPALAKPNPTVCSLAWRCLIARPYADSLQLSYSAVVINMSSYKNIYIYILQNEIFVMDPPSQIVEIKNCWKQGMLKPRVFKTRIVESRFVENKDGWIQVCWKQGLLNPWLLKSNVVESIIVEIKKCWIQKLLNAKCVECKVCWIGACWIIVVLNTRGVEFRSVEIK